MANKSVNKEHFTNKQNPLHLACGAAAINCSAMKFLTRTTL